MADLQGLTLVVSGVEQGLGRRSALAAAGEATVPDRARLRALRDLAGGSRCR